MGGALGPTTDIQVIRADDLALMVTIDKNGVGVVQTCRVDRTEAARLLRLLADHFEADPANAAEGATS